MIDALDDVSIKGARDDTALQVAKLARQLAVDPAGNVRRAVVKAVLDSDNKPDILAQQLKALCQGSDAIGRLRASIVYVDSDDLVTAKPVVGTARVTDGGLLAIFTTFTDARRCLESHGEWLSDDLRKSTLAHLNDLESLPVTAVDARVLRAAYTAHGDGTKLLDSLLQLDR